MELLPGVDPKSLSPGNYVQLLVIELDEIENQLAANDEEMKTKKARLRDIKLNLLPEAMQRAEMNEYEYDGRKLILDQEVHSNITKKNQIEAFAWLKANGHGDILQYEFKIKVPKKLRELVNPIRRDLMAMIVRLNAVGLEFEEKTSYAGPTLIKLIKTLRAAGKEVPESIGTFDPLVAKWEKVDEVELV